MVYSCLVLAASAILSLASAHGPELKRAPFEAAGIQPNAEGFGAPLAENEALASFAPPSLVGEKNSTIPVLKDRSSELVDRQTCGTGAGYCANIGKCCASSNLCCSWGYCIEAADTCCPGNPCYPGWNCCGANCSPKGADCCYDGSYCEAGNICVILGATGALVCCTDLSCTAAVVSGTTSYVTSTSRSIPSITIPDPPSITIPDLPSITIPDPPSITIPDPPSITEPPPLSSAVIYTSYYWTVTWWYLSFYWTTFERVESTVTYTRIYETTTYTTTATDVRQASSLFIALSRSLTFEPPPEAQTSLASLLNVEPSEIAPTSFSFDDNFTSASPEETSKSSKSARTTSSSTTTAATSILGAQPGAAASGLFVQWGLVGLGAVSGVLMLWL